VIAADIIRNNPNAGMRELDKMIGERLGISDRSARVIRLGLQQQQREASSDNNSG
jgi:hypothetical protein